MCLGIAGFAGVFLVILFYYQVFSPYSLDHLSISHYYYEEYRILSVGWLESLGYDGIRLEDIFVGFLTAIAAFLILFSGFSDEEDRLLSLSGFMLLGVALIPTAQDQSLIGTYALTPDWLSVHMLLAISFFALIAIVVVFFGPRRARYDAWRAYEGRFRRGYVFAASAMLLLPLIIALLHFGGRIDIPDWIFWAEFAAIVPFGIIWCMKVAEFDRILAHEQPEAG